MPARPVLKERQAFGPGIDEHPGLSVGRREDGRPDAERPALRLHRLRQGHPAPEEVCPRDLHGPGTVPDREGFAPRHLREVVVGGVGIPSDPPPPAGIEDAREEEDGGIDIRRSVAPRDPGVPGGARDHGDITVVEDLPGAPDEREGPGAAREEGDHG